MILYIPLILYVPLLFSTNLAQQNGVNPSGETVWNKHTWWLITCCSSPRLCCFSLIPGW